MITVGRTSGKQKIVFGLEPVIQGIGIKPRLSFALLAMIDVMLARVAGVGTRSNSLPVVRSSTTR